MKPGRQRGTACYRGENDHSNVQRGGHRGSAHGKEARNVISSICTSTCCPGVDDGARDEAAALAHARRLAAEGVRDVTVTPHVNRLLAARGRHHPGARRRARRRCSTSTASGCACAPAASSTPAHARTLSDAELELIAQGPPGSRWLLRRGARSAASTTSSPPTARRSQGAASARSSRTPSAPQGAGEPAGIAGAAQRCSTPAPSPRSTSARCSATTGCAVQETAVTLLRSGLAYVIASDGHPGTRDHTLALGFVLAQRAGASSVQAWRLTQANPRFLLTHGIPRRPRRRRPRRSSSRSTDRRRADQGRAPDVRAARRRGALRPRSRPRCSLRPGLARRSPGRRLRGALVHDPRGHLYRELAASWSDSHAASHQRRAALEVKILIARGRVHRLVTEMRGFAAESFP